LPDKK